MSTRTLLPALLFFLSELCFCQTITVHGMVFDKDSITPMPFAYAVNNNSSAATLTDAEGRFSLPVHPGDTLAFSYLGYSVTRVFTHTIKDLPKANLKVFLKPKASELKPVIITAPSFSKEVKESYVQKINEYYNGISSPLASPISAMYYAWSKRGRELEKLSALYQQLLEDEVREHRLSPERLRSITGNDTLDTRKFMNYCYLPGQFVMSASDYELFLAVKNCYRGYLESRRKKK